MKKLIFCFCILFCLTSASVSAQTKIFMKYGDVPGSATEPGYDDRRWMNIDALEFDIARAVEMMTGTTSTRTSNLPKFSPIKIVKRFDMSSLGLLNESLKAKGQEVEIHIVQAGSTVKIILKDAILKSHETKVAAGNNYVENISIVYSFIEVNYFMDRRSVGRVIHDIARGVTTN